MKCKGLSFGRLEEEKTNTFCSVQFFFIASIMSRSVVFILLLLTPILSSETIIKEDSASQNRKRIE